jgi:hypothetical protein
MIFYLVFPLRCRQADIVATISSPMSLTPVINYCRCCCYRQKSHIWCHGIDENLSQGLSNHKCQPHQQIIYRQYETSNHLSRVSLTPCSKQRITSIVDTGKKHKVANISLNFCKNLQWPLLNTVLRGPGETDS